MIGADSGVQAVRWSRGRLELLDQRRLPKAVEYVAFDHAADVAEAIRDMVVRGAPAIGVTAAYAVVLAARDAWRASPERWRAAMSLDLERLGAARPTAVNLRWAIERMGAAAGACAGDPQAALLAEARAIHAEDVAANRRMGELGAAVIEAGSAVITHCNAGALATGGYGTALGVIRSGVAAGRISRVFADETRPWLQGARLTAWELLEDGIAVELIADGAAGHVMRTEGVGWVIVGADRVAANGDVANKIGTYSLAVNARHHGVGFMVVAPCSTIDPRCPSGADIPIENRHADEILGAADARVAAPGAGALNPVFDVTPASLVDVLVTERGVLRTPDRDGIAGLLGAA